MDTDELTSLQIFVSPTITRKDNSKPCCTYCDISFLDPTVLMEQPLHALVFENHFVSSISCSQQVSDDIEFFVLDRMPLMPSVCSTIGAQQIFFIMASDFNSRFRSGLPIRIYLHQPSPQWTSFDIKHIKAYAQSKRNISNIETNIKKPLAADVKRLKDAIAQREKSGQIAVTVPSVQSTVKGKLRKNKRS